LLANSDRNYVLKTKSKNLAKRISGALLGENEQPSEQQRIAIQIKKIQDQIARITEQAFALSFEF